MEGSATASLALFSCRALPVDNRPGDTPPSRMGASVVCAAGLGDLVATSSLESEP